MDRERLIAELVAKGLPTDDGRLDAIKTLGRGGNGVALLCSEPALGEVVAKVYIPPDKRDLDDQSLGRFANEIKLASTIKHPYIIPAVGSGIARVGAYALPYYLMPQAASTLRDLVGNPRDPDEVQRVARLFLEACLGVSGLHTHGVVHRDLKPENVLISREGTAWVADLGIAHIDPEFVSVSLRTIAAERLLNRDYYAPEQRFGDHTDVDARADVYALGCILYELFAGTPPVRRDSPPVASISSEFAALDPVIDRMTSYDANARYQHLEAAITDVALALGWVAATIRGARRPEPNDVKEMVRLLRSSNGERRSTGVQLAVALGAEALPNLHELIGHGRREVRNAAATALAAIGDERSVPFIAAGLHGNSQKASTFRPTVDLAAEALRRYSVETRAAVIADLKQSIAPRQFLVLLEGFDSDAAFAAVETVSEAGHVLFDFNETPLHLLVAINEPKAWSRVRQQSAHMSGWTLAALLPKLSSEHQLELARNWMGSLPSDPWHWDAMVRVIARIPAPREQLAPVLEDLSARLSEYPGQARKQSEHRRLVGATLVELAAE